MATSNAAQEIETQIEAAIEAFRNGALAQNALNFFAALGYRSRRTAKLKSQTPAGLLELVNRPDFFNREKARPEQWSSIELLFQLTDEEVCEALRHDGQTARASRSTRLDLDANGQYSSCLFFSLQLKRESYTRTALADITREIDKLSRMPALVLFRHGHTLTLSFVNRPLHKRDPARGALERVTLIKDIRIENPHRAHVELLARLAFSQLAARRAVTNFVELHDAWRATLDLSALHRRFYQDLADWYFRALAHVEFPAQQGVPAGVNRATNVIRLITRLIFVWFLKERQLVPDALFHPAHLRATLKDFSPTSSTFYKAILQNLFFATLNTPSNDPANPREYNQYRHKKLFRDPDAALRMFASVPFLNGGLFECLDKRAEVNGKTIEMCVDGFSDSEKNQPIVPNRLFFCDEHDCVDDGVDLNKIYGTRNRTYNVRGLIDTLNRYKFTLAENTAVEEEFALDPELPGKVFENLLATYNPETGATARKQTGSFYTPREIVNHMVDESLIAYLEPRLASSDGEGQTQSAVLCEPDDASLHIRLRQLFAYTNEPHEFTEEEVWKLIKAISEVTILDPACGSGAYPMGILAKLVLVLSKLDPQNARWRQQQIERVRDAMRATQKIEHAKFRERTLQDLQARLAIIEAAFQHNEPDYARKLFLIENCIYGVDIHPVAIQISKLRFFISLISDQRIRPEADNLGIRPLPHLESNFVAANTLFFNAGRTFSLPDNFDIVIGNPPYGLLNKRQNKHESITATDEEIKYYKSAAEYAPAAGGMLNAYRLFVIKSINLLRQGGFLSEILPLAFVGDVSAAKLRRYILDHCTIRSIEAFPERDNEHKRVFEAVKMSVCILNLERMKRDDREFFVRTSGDRFVDAESEKVFLSRGVVNAFDGKNHTIPLLGNAELSLLRKVYENASLLTRLGHCYTGEIDLTLGQKYLTGDPTDAVLIKGALIDKYLLRKKMSQGEIKFINSPKYLAENRGKKSSHHQFERIVMQAITGVNEKIRLKLTIIDRGIYCANSVNYLVLEDNGLDLKYLLGVLNSKLLNFVFSKSSTNSNVNGYEVDNLPIKVVNARRQAPLIKLAGHILDARRKAPNADTRELEREIDRLVYRLYDLTSEEIALVEASARR